MTSVIPGQEQQRYSTAARMRTYLFSQSVSCRVCKSLSKVSLVYPNMAEPAPKRVATVTDADVERIIAERTPKSTKDSTKNWVAVLDTFMKKANMVLDLKTWTKDDLCHLLCLCYVGMRTQKGENYQYSSYKGFPAAIQRHLNDLGRKFDIFNGMEFRRSNDTFDGMIKKLKREGGMNPIAHKDIITDTDMYKITYLFDTKKDAKCLIQQVWSYVTMHFGIRGRELQCNMRKQDLLILKDSNGQEYIQLATDFAQKNHQLDTIATPAGRIQKDTQVLS
eukprot:scpid99806/ scgid19360/ 